MGKNKKTYFCHDCGNKIKSKKIKLIGLSILGLHGDLTPFCNEDYKKRVENYPEYEFATKEVSNEH